MFFCPLQIEYKDRQPKPQSPLVSFEYTNKPTLNLWSFSFFQLEYNCFTKLYQFLLHKEVRRLYVYRHRLRQGPPPPPSGSSQSAALRPCAVSRAPSCLTRCVCMSVMPSHSAPPSPSLPRPRVSFLHPHLYSCPVNRFLCTIFFLDSTHMR